MRFIYWLLTRFNWGFGLVSSVLALIRDVGTVLLVLALVFGIKLNHAVEIGIGPVAFIAFVGLGEVLKRRGYLDYATKLGNSVNPEIKEIVEWTRRQP